MQVPAPVLFCCRVLQGPRGPPRLTRAPQHKPVLVSHSIIHSHHSTAHPPALARHRANEGKLLHHLQRRPQQSGPNTASKVHPSMQFCNAHEEPRFPSDRRQQPSQWHKTKQKVQPVIMLNLLRKEQSGNKRWASFLLTKDMPVRRWLSSS